MKLLQAEAQFDPAAIFVTELKKTGARLGWSDAMQNAIMPLGNARSAVSPLTTRLKQTTQAFDASLSIFMPAILGAVVDPTTASFAPVREPKVLVKKLKKFAQTLEQSAGVRSEADANRVLKTLERASKSIGQLPDELAGPWLEQLTIHDSTRKLRAALILVSKVGGLDFDSVDHEVDEPSHKVTNKLRESIEQFLRDVAAECGAAAGAALAWNAELKPHVVVKVVHRILETSAR